jgi:hypothetical protein
MVCFESPGLPGLDLVHCKMVFDACALIHCLDTVIVSLFLVCGAGLADRKLFQ